MAYHIDVLSIGGNFDAEIVEAAQVLNGVQGVFRFDLPPNHLLEFGHTNFKSEYLTEDIFAFLERYLDSAKGGRRYVIGVVGQELRSKEVLNLFASRKIVNDTSAPGIAVVTLRDWPSYSESVTQFLCYYFIRYALSFLDPRLRSHRETRDCFFDFKHNKADLQKSLESGNLCPEHREQIAESFTPEVKAAFEGMTHLMKSLKGDSEEDLPAASLKGSSGFIMAEG